jgi:hypothetical protein
MKEKGNNIRHPYVICGDDQYAHKDLDLVKTKQPRDQILN